jgi:hypothetical protein
MVMDKVSFDLLGKIWLDQIVFRLHKAEDVSTEAARPLFEIQRGDIVFTNVTLQGDGDGITDCLVCGVNLRNASMYVEGEFLDQSLLYAELVRGKANIVGLWSNIFSGDG